MNFDYLFDNPDQVLRLTVEHLQLVAVSLLLALASAVPLSLLLASVARLTLPVLTVLGIVYTIPSLALLAALIPALGIGRQPAVIVLAAYAQLALVRNFTTALRGVERATIEAARGVGMNAWQVFFGVRLPIAVPVLLAGVRIALVSTISLASIMAWVNAGGLGRLLFDGISRDYPSMILAGAVSIIALALAADAALRLIERAAPTSRAARPAR